jgi:serine/threonine-protein kinase TNNI3K
LCCGANSLLALIDEQYKTVPMEDDGIGHSQGQEEPYQKLLEELSLERRKTVDRNDSMSISSKTR